MLIGDSYTDGACVSDGNTLRDRLVRHVGEVISVGAGGYGPMAALATVREFVARVRPRAVIWFFNAGNDVSDLVREIRNPILNRYLNERDFRQPKLEATDAIRTAQITDYRNWLSERQAANNQSLVNVAYRHFIQCRFLDAGRSCQTHRFAYRKSDLEIEACGTSGFYRASWSLPAPDQAEGRDVPNKSRIEIKS